MPRRATISDLSDELPTDPVRFERYIENRLDVENRTADMDDLVVGRLMTSPVETVSPSLTVQEAGQKMLDQDIGSVVVVDDDDRLEGILTKTDIARALIDETLTDPAVEAHMTAAVITTDVNEPFRKTADTMIEHGIHRVPVVEDSERVIGIISTADLTGYLSYVQQPSPD